MKLLAIVAAASLALAGCQTIGADGTISEETAVRHCRTAQLAQAGYIAAGLIVPKTQDRRVDAVFATVARLCEDPANINIVTLIAAIGQHAAAIRAAEKAAKET